MRDKVLSVMERNRKRSVTQLDMGSFAARDDRTMNTISVASERKPYNAYNSMDPYGMEETKDSLPEIQTRFKSSFAGAIRTDRFHTR